MNTEDLKSKKGSVDERAQKLIESLGLSGDERSVIVGLQKGDKFSLSGMSKVELKQREGAAVKFVPITFTTNSGATLGSKHFVGVFISDEAPAVGSTPIENAKFLVWCQDHNVVFKVQNLLTEDIEANGDIPAYVKKTYKLVAVSVEEEEE